jgi:hypothetical protein
MNSLKTNLKNIPIELFEKIEILLSEYGMEDIEVTGIDVTTNREPTEIELTEEDCSRQGKRLKCKKRKDGTIKCWCVRR